MTMKKSAILVRSTVCFPLFVLFYIFVFYCSNHSPVDTGNSASPDINFEYCWTSDIMFSLVGVAIPHDNRILETPNFLVFSDASDDAIKLKFAQIAEESLSEITEAFEISSREDLGIRNSENKIKIFSNKQLLNTEQRASPIGFILFSLESPYWTEHPELEMSFDKYKRMVKHETMHVVTHKFGLVGEYGHRFPDLWFNEGIAEHISGGASDAFTTFEEVIQWRQFEFNTNPVSIHDWSDFPNRQYFGEYYPMFGLAVRYLLDEKGHGKTYSDVKNMFYDMLTTENFSVSFEKFMGFSLDYYEEHFFSMIENLLR